MNVLDLLFKRKPEPRGSEEFKSLAGKINHFQLFDELYSLYMPDQLDQRMGGIKGMKRMYRQDPDLAALVEKRFSEIDNCELQFTDGSDENIEKAYKWIEPLKEDIIQISKNAILYGFSCAEVFYDVSRKEIKPIGMLEHDQNHFTPLIDKKSVLLPGTTKVPAPYGKILMAQNGMGLDFPKGDALLRRLYIPWMFSVQGVDYWATFIKKFGGGFLKGHVDDPDMAEDLLATLDKAFKSASLVTTGEGVSAEVVSTQNSGETFLKFDERMLSTKARLICGEVLTSTDAGSTNAATKTQNEVRKEKVETDIKVITRTINNFLTNLFELNQVSSERPVASFMKERGLELERTDRDFKLSKTLSFTKEYYLKHYGFEPEDIEVRPEPLADEPFLTPIESSLTLAKTNKKLLSPSFQQLEEIIELADRQDIDAVEKQMMINAIQSARNPKDLEEKLAFLAQTDSKEFTDLMTQIQMIAGVQAFGENNEKK